MFTLCVLTISYSSFFLNKNKFCIVSNCAVAQKAYWGRGIIVYRGSTFGLQAPIAGIMGPFGAALPRGLISPQFPLRCESFHSDAFIYLWDIGAGNISDYKILVNNVWKRIWKETAKV
jgi:hypothetical protein